MGLDYDELFPGRFLKSGEFKGKDVTYTISNVRTEELPDDKRGMRIRGVLAFHETKKELVLNRTNGECLKAMWGRDTGAWVGKKLTLWPAPYTDQATGEVGTAVRVRGSPDLTQDLTFELKLPRKKAASLTMRRTGGPARQASAPPINVAAWTDEKLSGRLDTLQKWADGARPDHPDMTKTKLEMSIIENELERRMSAAPPPPGDDAPGAENAAGAP